MWRQRYLTAWVLGFSVVTIAAGPATSWGGLIDLTTVGASGTASGGMFYQFDSTTATGTGTFVPFVRIEAKDVEWGYNTDARPTQFDEKTDKNSTHSVKVSEIPTITRGGVTYWEFVLDVGEGGNATASKISLDELKVFVQDTGDLDAYPATFTNKAYDLGDNCVMIDGGLVGSGNGRADMLAYIPVGSFGSSPDKYLYLYSKFGDKEHADTGFEEWAYAAGGPVAPEPATMSLLVLGGIATLIRRRNRR